MNKAYPNDLSSKEAALVEVRRERARKGKNHPTTGDLNGPQIGVACSGGGIRSATFCLGFFQGLAKLKDRSKGPLHLLKAIDFLSTVSGGGYFGAFLGRLITRGEQTDDASGIERAETALEDNHSEEMTWLRDNGRYISPTGAGDTLVALVIYLRNWITLHFVLGGLIVLFFLLVNTVRTVVWELSPEETLIDWIGSTGIWWSPSIIVAFAVLLVAGCPLGWAYWLAQRDPKTARSRTPLFGSGIVVLTGLFLLDIADNQDDVIDLFLGWEILVVPLMFSIPIMLIFSSLLFKFIRNDQRYWMGLGFVVIAAEIALVIRPDKAECFLNADYSCEALTGVLALLVVLGIISAAVILLMHRFEGETPRQRKLILGGLVIGLLAIAAYVWWAFGGGNITTLIKDSGYLTGVLLLTVVSALSFILLIFAIQFAMTRTPDNLGEGVRNSLSLWLARSAAVIGLLAVFALVDSLGQTLYAAIKSGSQGIILQGMLTAVAGSGGIAMFAKPIADMFSGKGGETSAFVRVPLSVMAGIASLVLWGSLLILYSVLAHSILWQGKMPTGDPGTELVAEWAKQPAATTEIRLQDGGSFAVIPMEPVALSENSSAPIAKNPNSFWGMLGFDTLLFGLVLLISINVAFVNFSSHQRLYRARLVRAYLGASNPLRRTTRGKRISQNFADDDIAFDNYAPHEEGGPLHLVSVTINETIDGRSQIEQRDRKGLAMCIGPAGMSASQKYHSLWKPVEKKLNAKGEPEEDSRFEVFLDKPDHTTEKWVEIEPLSCSTGADSFHLFRSRKEKQKSELVERLTLGDWVSISGAAFSTGLGARTSRGLSSLMGFINMRLGYWWDSGIAPQDRDGFSKPGYLSRMTRLLGRLLPVHSYLLDEILASFRGPGRRHWYLSDGGHFENTGCYELLRRRVPMIVVLDCGADPNYDFEDLANLVRKARIDFGAEIEFFSQMEIDKHVDPDISRYFGTPAQMRRQSRELKDDDAKELFHGRSYSKKHAALARVRFPGSDEPESEILWIKPSMVGDEPLDLRNYHGQNSDFPQETTADQFFDEAQWESYRKLGESIAKRLFYDDPRPEQSWTPLRWFTKRKKLVDFTTPKGASTECPYCHTEMWISVDPMEGSPQQSIEKCDECGKGTRFQIKIDEDDLVNITVAKTEEPIQQE